MNEACQTILNLMEQTRNPNPAIAQNACQQMEQIFLNPESILPILEIAENSNNAQVQHFAIVHFTSLTRRYRFNLPSIEFLFAIKQKSVNIIQSATVTVRDKRSIIDNLITFNSCNENTGFGTDFPQIALSLIQQNQQNPSLAAAGLYFVSVINDIKYFNTDIVSALFSMCLSYIQSGEFELVIIAYQFVSFIFNQADFPQFVGFFEPIAQQLMLTFQKIYTTPVNPQEANEYFNLLASIMSLQDEYFYNNFLSTVVEVKNRLVDRNVDSMIRISSFQVLVAAVENFPDLFIESVFEYIHNSALFTLELYQDNGEFSSLYLASELFERISGCLLETIADPEQIFEIFMNVNKLLLNMNTVPATMVIFMVFESISKVCIDSIIENFEQIEDLLIKSFSTNDPNVIEVASKFILNIASESNVLSYTLLSTFEPIMLNFLVYDFVLDAIAKIYDVVSDKEPNDYKMSLSALCNQFTNAHISPVHIEKVVEAISYLLVTISNVETEIYSTIRPYLIQLLQSDESGLRAAIFCFSTFAFSSPEVIIQDLPMLANAIEHSLKLSNVYLRSVCSTAIITLIDKIPTTFRQYCPKLLPLLIAIFDNDDQSPQPNENDDEGYDEYDEYVKNIESYARMRQDILNCISVMFNAYASDLAAQSELIEQKVLAALTVDDIESVNILSGAFTALRELIPAFFRLNLNTDQLIHQFLSTSQIIDDEDTLCDFWDTIANITSNVGQPLLIKYGQSFFDEITSVFRNQKSVYSKTKKRFELKNKFIIPITRTLSRFFAEFGALSAPFAQPGSELLNKLIQTTKGSHGPAARSLSHIVKANAPNLNNMIPNIIQLVFPLINSKNDATREAAFDTINALVYLAPNIFQNSITQIYRSVNEVIQNTEKYSPSLTESAVVLWCSVVMGFNIPLNSPEELQTVLELIPPPSNSILLEYTAMFATFAINKWPEIFTSENLFQVAIAVLASDDYVVRSVRREEIVALASCISQAPQEKVVEIIRSDENQLSKIQKNVHLILG